MLISARPQAGFAAFSSRPAECRGDGDLNFIPLDPNFAARDLEVRIADSFSRDDVEFPAMPGAFDDRLAQRAFSERATRVRTGIIDRIKSAVYVEDRNPNPIHFHGSSRAGWKFMGEGHSHEIIHHIHLSLGPSCAASEGRLLDFTATLWHRTISVWSYPPETLLGRYGGPIGDEVPAWK